MGLQCKMNETTICRPTGSTIILYARPRRINLYKSWTLSRTGKLASRGFFFEYIIILDLQFVSEVAGRVISVPDDVVTFIYSAEEKISVSDSEEGGQTFS